MLGGSVTGVYAGTGGVAATTLARTMAAGGAGGSVEGAFHAALDGQSLGGIARASVTDGLIAAATGGILDRTIIGIGRVNASVKRPVSQSDVAPRAVGGADDAIRIGRNGQLELHPSVYHFETPIIGQGGLAVRYHYGPTSAVDGILGSGVLRATDIGPPLAGTPKAWVTTITPEHMSGPLGWAHRLRLGFSPSSSIPTPHIRNGMLVLQREDGWIQIVTPVGDLQRAPWWKAPFGGQEYYPGDIFVMPNTPTGGF